MNELPYFHVAYVVPDLEAAMSELEALGVRWQEPADRPAWRRVFSIGPPPMIELIEGEPGTLWHAADGARLDHVGRLTYDLDASIEEFEAAGGRIEVDGREISGPWVYFRMPITGALVEIAEADDETRRTRYGIGC